MDLSSPPRRTIVVKANRDTLVLVAAAAGLTCALAYAVHTRPAQTEIASMAPVEDWTGRLAAVAPGEKSGMPIAPLTSDALTLPKSAMALPSAPKPAPTRTRVCDGAPCPGKVVASAPTPSRRPIIEARETPARHAEDETSLIARINPMNHIPDAVKKPFAYAGDAVSSWIRRF